jgi:glycosyltransferase involved in cell wall biosynthesis
MKILLLSTNADLAGAPLHVKQVALSLFRDGHDVVVVFGVDGVVKDYLDAQGVRTRVVYGMRSSINPFKDIRAYLDLIRIVKGECPDLIHCHSAKAGMIGRLVASKLKIPCIYTVHGWGFGVGRKILNSIILKIVEKSLKSLTANFIAVSEADRLIGIDVLGISKKNIKTIRNGINFPISPANLRPSAARVIMVARNDFQKDYITLSRAISLSSIKYACYVGAGTDELVFKSKVIKYVGEGCIIDFLGLRNDVNNLLESSSIFVLSSRYEALPLSIIEAMSKGLPIIASNVGGNNELIVHGLNGFLFKSGDALELARYLDILNNDEEMRRKMGAESIRRYLLEFSEERMMADLYEVYNDALDKLHFK